jgi:transglutaminase-like putative cysteine protease
MLRVALLTAFSVIGAPIAGAAAAPPPISNLLLTSDYEVAADGTYTRTTHLERRAGSDAAAQRIAQFAATYSPSLGRLEVVAAYTRKPDDRLLPVTESGIRDQIPPGDPGLRTFTDQRQKVIVFPQVAAGDIVGLTVREHVSRPRFAGIFTTWQAFSPSEAWDDVRISIRAPTELPLKFEAVGADVAQDADAETITYRWRFSAPAATGEDLAAIAPIDRWPRLIATSVANWEAIGRAYAALAAPKAAVTPLVQQLADDITAGVDDRRQQAEKLYAWVASHIRYVAVWLGNGAVEPHTADTILANGYGDCKDHVVLFGALLKAKGIASEDVLINLGNSYLLTVSAPFPRLNHVISYLPEFRIYADTTAGLAPFGILPLAEYGKSVIHATATGPAMRQVPVLAPDAATTTLTTVAHFTENGRIVGESTTEATGPFALGLRQAAQRIETAGNEAGSSRMLHELGEDGTGQLEMPSVDLSAPAVTAVGHFDVDGSTHIAGGNLLSLPTGLRLLVRPGDLLLGRLNQHGLPDSAPTPCYAGRQIEVLRLTLPPDRHVARLPAGRTVAEPEFAFSSQWSADGRTVTVRREFAARIDQTLCAGGLRAEAARALATIRRDYDDRVILDE